jgi:hypothetical protein
VGLRRRRPVRWEPTIEPASEGAPPVVEISSSWFRLGDSGRLPAGGLRGCESELAWSRSRSQTAQGTPPYSRDLAGRGFEASRPLSAARGCEVLHLRRASGSHPNHPCTFSPMQARFRSATPPRGASRHSPGRHSRAGRDACRPDLRNWLRCRRWLARRGRRRRVAPNAGVSLAALINAGLLDALGRLGRTRVGLAPAPVA